MSNQTRSAPSAIISFASLVMEGGDNYDRASLLDAVLMVPSRSVVSALETAWEVLGGSIHEYWLNKQVVRWLAERACVVDEPGADKEPRMADAALRAVLDRMRERHGDEYVADILNQVRNGLNSDYVDTLM